MLRYREICTIKRRVVSIVVIVIVNVVIRVQGPYSFPVCRDLYMFPDGN